MQGWAQAYFCTVDKAQNNLGRHFSPTRYISTPYRPMSAMFILIGASLLVAVGFLFAFFWAAGSGQYEDGYTPSVRVLFDDEKPDKD